MKPTRCPAARRIAVRHAPVEPLPFVPAINAPFRPRSGAPRRSRIARVRSVPSFIAKRPCFEMKSSASWYVNVSAPAPDLSLEGVLDQHRPRHRPDSPRVWRQPACNRIDTGPEVATWRPPTEFVLTSTTTEPGLTISLL